MELEAEVVAPVLVEASAALVSVVGSQVLGVPVA